MDLIVGTLLGLFDFVLIISGSSWMILIKT